MQWMIDNSDWIFSGIGVTIISLIVGELGNLMSFKLTYRFYVSVYIGFTIWVGIDYFYFPNVEFQFKLFICLICIALVFVVQKTFYSIYRRLYMRNKTKIAVKRLNISECQYVMECYHQKKYIQYGINLQDPMEEKWDGILYVKTGQKIALNEDYRISVNSYALKLIEERLKKGGMPNET